MRRRRRSAVELSSTDFSLWGFIQSWLALTVEGSLMDPHRLKSVLPNRPVLLSSIELQ